PSDGALALAWRQIHNPLIWMLIASAALAMALDKTLDGLVVLAVVIANSGIGFVQELRASRTIDALLELLPEHATVMRGGRRTVVGAPELVPGDIVLLVVGADRAAGLLRRRGDPLGG